MGDPALMDVADTRLERELFGDLDPAQQRARMEAAQRMWDSDPNAPRWETLSEAKQIAAVRTMHLVDEVRATRHECPVCDDSGDVPGPEGSNSVWFCACHVGLRKEAGYWFRRVYVKRGRQLVAVDSEKAKFLAYLRTRRHGVQIREAVNQLADKTEQEEA